MSQLIRGDTDPQEFSYTMKLSREERLTLFLRNGKLQKATDWMAGEILRERWTFQTEQPITGVKHGLPFVFTTFDAWLEWTGFLQEVHKALTWSLLFGESILVYYDGKEQSAPLYKNTHDIYLNGPSNFITCKAYYPITYNNGYTSEEDDEWSGLPLVYKITSNSTRRKKTKTYYVNKNRTVRFYAPQKDLKYEGTSNIATIEHDCLIQEQIKRAIAVQMNNLSSGIVAINVKDDDEKDAIDADITDQFNYLHKFYYTGEKPADDIIKLIVPDFNVAQIAQLNTILQTDIATGISISTSNLEGAPQGAISSAKYDSYNTYSRVKQFQSHYKKAFEEAFYMFGKTDTTFEWNEVIIGEQENVATDTPSNTPNTESDPGTGSERADESVS